jgi:hypothetical protein
MQNRQLRFTKNDIIQIDRTEEITIREGQKFNLISQDNKRTVIELSGGKYEGLKINLSNKIFNKIA